MTTATALKPSVPKQPPSPNTTGRVIAAAKSAYQYPLIIKHLWHAPLLQARDQEIVYRDLRRLLTASSGSGSAAWPPRLQEWASGPAIRSGCWTGTVTDFSRRSLRCR